MNETTKFDAKVLVAGCACVIFSALAPDEIRNLQRLHPEALKLIDEDTSEEVFRIELDQEGPGCLEEDKACFSAVTSVNGKATITVIIDPEVEDKVKQVTDFTARPIRHLVKLEEHILEMLPRLNEEMETVRQRITAL